MGAQNSVSLTLSLSTTKCSSTVSCPSRNTHAFTYLGSMISENGGCEEGVRHRVGDGWGKRRDIEWELVGERSDTSRGSWMGKEVRHRVGAGWGKK